MADFIDEHKLIQPDDQVLDVGCGTGVMAFEFSRRLGPAGKYVGFDVDRSAIEWCRASFVEDARFSFDLAEIASPYGSPISRGVGRYRFPMSDETAGLVLAKSVFTHILEADARQYLGEIRRTLTPGRTAVITAFLFEKGSLVDRGRSPLFPFSDDRGLVHWRWKARPESAIAYERDSMTQMIAEAGLYLRGFCQGFWPGNATSLTGQDVLLVSH